MSQEEMKSQAWVIGGGGSHSASVALRQGDCSSALASARAAQQLQATAEGRLLVGIAGEIAIQGE